MKTNCKHCGYGFTAKGQALREGVAECPQCSKPTQIKASKGQTTNASCPHVGYCYMRAYCSNQSKESCNFCGPRADLAKA